MMTLPLMRLPHALDLPVPTYQTTGAAGLDLMAAVPADAPVRLAPGAFATIPTGISVAIPQGYEAQVRPRSGLAAKYGVTVLNAPGTVDADYRGEIGVILINHGPNTFDVARGQRIAQLVISAVIRVDVTIVSRLAETDRGGGGFGSTGL
jgi:dUTP pyrophosphatase